MSLTRSAPRTSTALCSSGQWCRIPPINQSTSQGRWGFIACSLVASPISSQGRWESCLSALQPRELETNNPPICQPEVLGLLLAQPYYLLILRPWTLGMKLCYFIFESRALGIRCCCCCQIQPPMLGPHQSHGRGSDNRMVTSLGNWGQSYSSSGLRCQESF